MSFLDPAPDFSNLDLSGVTDFSSGAATSLPGTVSAPTTVGGSVTDALSSLRTAITGTAQAYYGAQSDIARAQAQAAIAKAQAKGQVVQAQYGLPSPSVLLWGGIGLAALALIFRHPPAPAPAPRRRKS